MTKQLKDLQPGDMVFWRVQGDRVPEIAPILNVTKTRIRVQRGHVVYEFDRENGRRRCSDWRNQFTIYPLQDNHAEEFGYLAKHRDAWRLLETMAERVLQIKRVRKTRYNETSVEKLGAAIAALDEVLNSTAHLEKQS